MILRLLHTTNIIKTPNNTFNDKVNMENIENI